jgi:ATP-dependent Lhr-like helicase
MEARRTVRGGRFVSGFGGEQFALPEAVESLREIRRRGNIPDAVTYSAADPMNMVGIVIPGERSAAIPGRCVTYPVTNDAGSANTETDMAISPGGLPFSAALEGGALA